MRQMRSTHTQLNGYIIATVMGMAALAPSQAAFANTSPTPQTLVALGDSITFGYNLNPTNKRPSQLAFPYLIAKQDGLTALDLGVPGWTTDDLLTALQKPSMQAALQQAAVVTVDIGNNDLLSHAYPLIERAFLDPKVHITAQEKGVFLQSIEHFATVLPEVLTKIESQTKAPIILYNLYNPFASNNRLHALTDPFIKLMNGVITADAIRYHCLQANAYGAFNHQQLQDVLPLDVHPTIAGQRSLAELSVRDLTQYKTEQATMTAILKVQSVMQRFWQFLTYIFPFSR